jgi:hypothetical protein
MRTGDWHLARHAFRAAADRSVSATLSKVPVIRAEEAELQVKTTETGHIACHLLLT